MKYFLIALAQAPVVSLVGWVPFYFLIIFIFGSFVNLASHQPLHFGISYGISCLACVVGICCPRLVGDFKKGDK